jgi:hypothetical protein
MLAIVGGLLWSTIKSQRDVGVNVDLRSLWRYGVGNPNRWAMALTGLMRKFSQVSGFFFAVFFANMFQVVVSALYLLYNNLLTVMVVASEWNNFVYERKTLRLSSPHGIQRSNYFLSLPYKYSLTLMILSGLLHWIISQSVFVVQTVAYRTPEFQPEEAMDASSIGYSSISIILAITIGTPLVFTLLILGFTFKYKAKAPRDGGEVPLYPMPLASTCSAAISANCHRHHEDFNCWLLPVRWGFVSDTEGGNNGHFTFTTARDVKYPRLASSFAT